MRALDALAERCEAATGPDRDLERAIKAALVGREYISYEDDLAKRQGATPPQYTASINAALTLLPEGYEFATGSGRRDSLAMKLPWGNVFAPDDIGSKPVEAATPALALCAAALRARAAL